MSNEDTEMRFDSLEKGLRDIQETVEEIKRALIGDMNGGGLINEHRSCKAQQSGLVDTLANLQARVLELEKSRIWVLAAASAGSLIVSIVWSLYTHFSK
jgi:hypothetical protein